MSRHESQGLNAREYYELGQKITVIDCDGNGSLLLQCQPLLIIKAGLVDVIDDVLDGSAIIGVDQPIFTAALLSYTCGRDFKAP
jgi:hypothetical protein